MVSAQDRQVRRDRRSRRDRALRARKTLAQRRQEREIRRAEGELRSQKARGVAERGLTRTLSGAIYAVAMFGLIFLGSIATAILAAAISWLCCSEFLRLTRALGRSPFDFLALAGAVAFPLVPLINDQLDIWVLYVLVIACGVWFVVTPRASVVDVAITVFAPIYTGFMMSALVSIRLVDPGSTGALMALGVLGSIWANDAAAYFAGKRFGRHKMSPKISPHKTWEGLAGGFVGGLILWFAMLIVGLPGITVPIVLVGSVLTTIAGVLGDLFESRVKRAAGVKDSGDFLPGHGGLLDRTDSQLFGLMTGYLVLKLGGVL